MIEQPKHEDCEECIYKTSVNKSKLNDLVISPATKQLKEIATTDFLRDIATEFFYWWHNQPGTNTPQGFDDWWRINHSRFGL